MFFDKDRIKYYKDEKNDDFANTKTSLSVNVDSNYKYLPNNIFFKIFSFFVYYFIALPVFTLARIFFARFRVKGRLKLLKLYNKGFFIYANHTSSKDAWMAQSAIVPFRRVYVIANKDAIQIPIVNVLVKALGGLPVADTMGGLKNLKRAVNKIIDNKKVMLVFPEAHIWPYYTKVRPFPITSFKFPASTNAPVVPVAVCYKRKLFFGDLRKPKSVVYIGDPIYPKSELRPRENAIYLRDKVYSYIVDTTTKYSTYAYYQYIKQDDNYNETIDNDSYNQDLQEDQEDINIIEEDQEVVV